MEKKYVLVTWADKNKPCDEIVETEDRSTIKGWSSLGVAYNTKEELIIGEQLLDKPCPKCGGVIKLRWAEPYPALLKEKGICFHCEFWESKIPSLSNPRRIIVDGECYWRDDDAPAGTRGFLGFGGAEFKIKRFDTPEIIISHNMWGQGPIPDRWRDIFKDNAEFVKTTGEVVGEKFLESL